jgi:phospholipid/cholesterol/gamma-HCH transport system permease protein
VGLLADTGCWLRQTLWATGYTVNLLLDTGAKLYTLPRRVRFLLDHAFIAGVKALPVTLVVALFAGAILALQTGIELQRYGQSNMIGTITALTMCREMGPFITALILAATVGSAMAAELGTMKVSDEVTALDVMSVDTTSYLVLPRVVALTVMCPVLTLFSDLIGIYGGGLVGTFQLDISDTTYWKAAREALQQPDRLLPKDVYTGLAKAVVFGCVVATVSCSSGMRADGGALGVGRAVQQAVKTSVILITVLGYILTWIFYFLFK